MTRSTAGSDRRATTKGQVPGQGQSRDVGSALRSVYQKTVEETVPDDLLDLLSKLG